MKLLPTNPSPRRRNAACAVAAFTFPELLTSLAIFVTVIGGIVSAQIVGLRLNARAISKTESTAASLKVLNQVGDRVLEADSAIVGNGNNHSFTPTGTNGNALQVFSSVNTNNYLLFFMSTNTGAFYEWNSTNPELFVLAENITNESVFQTVNFQGNVFSGNQEHYSIRMTLNFAQLNFRIPTNSYEYYTLETQMTPRGQ